MITLTRTGLLLTLSTDTIPAQGSSDVPISFVNDPETYSGYTVQPLAGWYKNGCKQSAVCRYADDTIKVPAAAFQQNGEIMLAIALIDPADANHIEVTQPASAYVIPAPNDPTDLPDEDTWQTAVESFTNQLFDNYTSEAVQPILDDAQQALAAARQQQQQIDSAISQMGEYQIVSEDPVQIQFKQGDGTYGQTVDLGDGLASKSMVNAGYYQKQNSVYSGSASDYGMEVSQIKGAYVQDGTPTPTAPIEPQFVEINNFYTNNIEGNTTDPQFTLNLTQQITLRALPNGVYDTLDNVNVGQITFDGSQDENWQFIKSKNGYYVFAITIDDAYKSDKYGGYTICDRFVEKGSNNFDNPYENGYVYYGVSGDAGRVIFVYDSVDSLQSWKTFIQTNPIAFWYQLATPTEQDISIPTLKSFYPFTNAWCDSLVQSQITWNVLTGRSSVLDGNGILLPQVYMTAPPNRLINGDFKINQRGQSSYTANGGTVDGWIKIYGSTTLIVTDNGVNISNVSSEYSGGFYQKVKMPESIVGSKFTIVAKINGSIYSKVKTIELSKDSNPIVNDYFNINVDYLSDGIRVYVEILPNKTISIEYIDLFEGTTAYLHVEEDYATALMRCLPYYRRVYMGYTAYALSNTFSMISAQSIVPMLNDSPTITVNVGNRTNVSAANYTYDESGAVILTATASAAGAIRIYNEIVELSCEGQ